MAIMFFLGSIITFMNEIEPNSHYFLLRTDQIKQAIASRSLRMKKLTFIAFRSPIKAAPRTIGNMQ